MVVLSVLRALNVVVVEVVGDSEDEGVKSSRSGWLVGWLVCNLLPTNRGMLRGHGSSSSSSSLIPRKSPGLGLGQNRGPESAVGGRSHSGGENWAPF